ncbi:lysozyme inhibitor LprI family protein [Luteibacter yeojuensis]
MKCIPKSKHVGVWYRCRISSIACVAITIASVSASSAQKLQDGSVGDPRRDSLDISIRSAYNECVGGGGETTAAILTCAHNEFSFQDDRLNKAYKTLMSRLGNDEKARLRSAERKWLAEKRQRCELPSEPGTIDQIIAADCQVRETARRATELEERI